MNNVVIALHGGAWVVPPHKIHQSQVGIRAAARTGYQVLVQGGSAMDAVEAAVCSMENNTCFNCGTGSVLTEDQTIEMDAFVMDGTTQNTGAVAGVSNVKNPVRLARAVMEKTNHCFLIGKAASNLAEKEGIELATHEDLLTNDAVLRLKNQRDFNELIKEYNSSMIDSNGCTGAQSEEHDTVGAVALDCNGNLAAATSTGGLSGKMAGRIGDSALCGSGGWAEANVGAVSCTGHGEAIMRVCLARRVASNMEAGITAQEAAQEAVNHMATRVKGNGGLVAVNSNGDVAVACSTKGLTWAYVKNDKLHSSLYINEEDIESV